MNLRYKTFLQRGLIAGALGGLCSALVIRFVVETQIGKAIGFEDATGLGAPAGEAAMFARSTQHWGAMAAAMLFGTAMGAVLSVAVAMFHHRIPATTEFGRTIRVAVAALVAIVLIPGLKYPPNPPTVGDPDTINQRSFSYLALMVMGTAIVLGSFVLWERLTAKGLDGAPRFAAVGGAFAVAISLAFVVFPANPDPVVPPNNEAAPALRIADDAPEPVLDEMLRVGRLTGDESIRNPKDTSEPLDLDTIDSGADLRGLPMAVSTTFLRSDQYTTMVWHFRIQSLAAIVVLWLVMGTTMGYLLDRKVAQAYAAAPEPASVA